MAVRPVLIYPDPRLKAPSSKVGEIDTDINQFIDDLIDTMYDAPGCVGLAAPQLGMPKRIILVDISRNPKCDQSLGLQVLINPEIVRQEGQSTAREGCLSLPHLTANVARATSISVRALLRQGEKIIFDAFDFHARVLLHEIDHLDGILFLDRVASLKTDVFRRKRYQVSNKATDN